MKISLRWLCDHLVAQWTDIDIDTLVQTFNTKTAEIEKVIHYKIDISNFTFAKVTEVSENSITVLLPEWKCVALLPFRSEVVIGQWYLIKKNQDSYAWVSYADMYSEKEGLLTAFKAQEEDIASGNWRQKIETEDYILEVDNKSITHRPDMWGHRGFAREIGALLNLEMVAEHTIVENNATEHHDLSYIANSEINSFPLAGFSFLVICII